jgi:hypothetical protein
MWEKTCDTSFEDRGVVTEVAEVAVGIVVIEEEKNV